MAAVKLTDKGRESNGDSGWTRMGRRLPAALRPISELDAGWRARPAGGRSSKASRFARNRHTARMCALPAFAILLVLVLSPLLFDLYEWAKHLALGA